MNEVTVFENLLFVNGEINQKYAYPNLDKPLWVRFFYRLIVKHYRRSLRKRIGKYDHNSFHEVLGFLLSCQRRYPPKGEYRNIHSIILMDNVCISSVLEDDIHEVIHGKEIYQIVYTITMFYSNLNECELIATVISEEGSNRYIFNIKDSFDPEQIQKYHMSGCQKRMMMEIVSRLRSILVRNARLFLYEEICRSERIEL